MRRRAARCWRADDGDDDAEHDANTSASPATARRLGGTSFAVAPRRNRRQPDADHLGERDDHPDPEQRRRDGGEAEAPILVPTQKASTDENSVINSDDATAGSATASAGSTPRLSKTMPPSRVNTGAGHDLRILIKNKRAILADQPLRFVQLDHAMILFYLSG